MLGLTSATESVVVVDDGSWKQAQRADWSRRKSKCGQILLGNLAKSSILT